MVCVCSRQQRPWEHVGREVGIGEAETQGGWEEGAHGRPLQADPLPRRGQVHLLGPELMLPVTTSRPGAVGRRWPHCGSSSPALAASWAAGHTRSHSQRAAKLGSQTPCTWAPCSARLGEDPTPVPSAVARAGDPMQSDCPLEAPGSEGYTGEEEAQGCTAHPAGACYKPWWAQGHTG